jgi:hypothetical protein
MRYPNVRFRLNKALDKKMMLEFLGLRASGINFANGILGPHPGIKRYINRYVDKFYKNHRTLLHKRALNFERKWKQKEKSFFQIVSFIFNNHPWPKGRYIGYVSIFDCNPRFLENKTFQVFFRHKLGPVYVTAHELLHFIFYDYLQKKRKALYTQLNEDELWQLSEVVNEVMLSLPPLRTVAKLRPSTGGYPALSKWVTATKRKVSRVTDINKVLKTALSLR